MLFSELFNFLILIMHLISLHFLYLAVFEAHGSSLLNTCNYILLAKTAILATADLIEVY